MLWWTVQLWSFLRCCHIRNLQIKLIYFFNFHRHVFLISFLSPQEQFKGYTMSHVKEEIFLFNTSCPSVASLKGCTFYHVSWPGGYGSSSWRNCFLSAEILGDADASPSPMLLAELESQPGSIPALPAAQPSCSMTPLPEDLSQVSWKDFSCA